MKLLSRLGRFWTSLLLLGLALVLLAFGLVLALIRFGSIAAPRVLSVSPQPNAVEVPLTTTFSLRFSEPMNRRSVEGALSIAPSVDLGWRWSDDGHEVSLLPSEPLFAGITYTLRLDTSASSRLLRKLEAPLSSSFRVAVGPVAEFIWPPPGGLVDADEPVVLRFSQQIVAAQELHLQRELDLAFDPPVDYRSRWVGLSTLLVEPTERLLPGQTYTVTVQRLTNVAGVPLMEIPRWRFHVRPPRLLATTPQAEGELDPGEPLVLEFAEPVDPAQIAAGLAISPALSLLPLSPPAPSTVISFTIAQSLTQGLRYSATLQLGQALVGEWSFEAQHEPEIIGRVPGPGQSIAPDQTIKLLFSRPPDEQVVKQTLRIDPPVEPVTITLDLDRKEVQVRAALEPAGTYTLSLRASAAGPPLELGFTTLGPGQALSIAGDPLLLVPAGELPSLRVSWSELAPPGYALYRLSRPLLLDALASPNVTINPRQQGLTPLRSWPASGTSGEGALLSLEDGEPLSPGAYLFEARSGLIAAQRLVVVSRYQLSIVLDQQELLVWAVSRSAGAAAVDLPLIVRSKGALIASNQRSDALGRWSTRLPYLPERLELVGGSEDDPAVALVLGGPLADREPRGVLLPDRLQYAPGETMRFVGAGFPARQQLGLRFNGELAQQRVQVDAAGMLSATVQIPPALDGGLYLLQASGEGRIWGETSILVAPRTAADPALLLSSAASVVESGAPLSARLHALSQSQPLAGARVSWRLLPFDGQPAASALLSGTLLTDQTGEGLISLVAPLAERPTDYLLEAELPGQASARLLFHVASRSLSILPAQQLLTAGSPGELLIQASGLDRQPAVDLPLTLEVERHTWPQGIERVEARPPLRVRTDQAGRARLTWRPDQPGLYTFKATSGLQSFASQVWVTAPGFRQWPYSPEDRLALVVDQPSYEPGATLRLLPLSSSTALTGLLTLSSPAGLESVALPLRQGEPISLTLPLSGPVTLEATLVERAGNGVALHRGRLAIPIKGRGAHLRLEIQPPNPRPGDLVSLRALLSDDQGAPISGTVALAFYQGLGASGALSDELALDRWLPRLTIPQSGRARLPIRLPWRPSRWQLRALLLSDSQLLAAPAGQLSFATHAPTEQRLIAPALLRAGDVISVTALVRSERPLSATQRLSAHVGLLSEEAPVPLSLDAGARGISHWDLTAQREGPGELRIELLGKDLYQRLSQPLEVRPSTQPALHGSAGLLPPGLAQQIDLPPLAPPGSRLVLEAATRLGPLLEPDQARLATRQDLFGAVGPLLLAGGNLPAPSQALERLLALQNQDGGWGWSPGAPSNLIASDLAIRALGRFSGAKPAAFAPALQLAITYLRARSSPPLPPDEELLRVAALAETGAATRDELLKLLPLESQLGPSDRALLALALEQTGAGGPGRAVLARLLEAPPVPVDGAGRPDRLPLLETPVRALALQLMALQALDRGQEQLIAERVRALLSLHAGDGWGSTYETTLALMALATLDLDRRMGLPQPLGILLNGRLLASGAGLQRIVVPLDQLPLASSFALTTTSGLAAYSWWLELPSSPADSEVMILRDYYELETQLPIAQADIRAGDLLLARLTLVLPRALALLELEEQLPPGALLGPPSGPPGFFSRSGPASFMLGFASLEAGVYQIEYTLQPIAPGRFTIPPARLRALDRAEALGQTQRLVVAP